MNQNQERWKSPVVWAAVIGQLITLAITVGWIDTGAGDAVNNVAATVLQLLVVVGVLNNPTSKDGF